MAKYPQVTIENALQAKFENCRWETAEEDGRKLVRFTGSITEAAHRMAAAKLGPTDESFRYVKPYDDEYAEEKRLLDEKWELEKGKLTKEFRDHNEKIREADSKISSFVREFCAPIRNGLKHARKEIGTEQDLRRRIASVRQPEPLRTYSGLTLDEVAAKAKEEAARRNKAKEQLQKDLETAKRIENVELAIDKVYTTELYLRNISSYSMEHPDHFWTNFEKLGASLTQLVGIFPELANLQDLLAPFKTQLAEMGKEAELLMSRREARAEEVNQLLKEAREKHSKEVVELRRTFDSRFRREMVWPTGSEVIFEWIVYPSGETFELAAVRNNAWSRLGTSTDSILESIFGR